MDEDDMTPEEFDRLMALGEPVEIDPNSRSVSVVDYGDRVILTLALPKQEMDALMDYCRFFDRQPSDVIRDAVRDVTCRTKVITTFSGASSIRLTF